MVEPYLKHYAHFVKGSHVILCFEEPCISNILLDASLVASGEKPKAFFPLTEIMPLKLENN